ncbi:Ig-like domain-containing protein [uncultured Lactococcus sp.]|uniref:Ig-like domain-containing protein n=1 Tax=uncultured Lactococcus sp. TaxID=167973 RepID=UPI0020583883|nr:MAG TPA: bacterial surface protein [Caudoviricetes sp.]
MLKKETLSLTVGDTKILGTTINSEDKTMTFTSNNETVAKVTPKQGKVTAVAEGTATITVTTANESLAVYEVTVTPAG